MRVDIDICIQLSTVSSCLAGQVKNNNNDELNGGREKRKEEKREVNDYSGTIMSERRRWRTHMLGPTSIYDTPYVYSSVTYVALLPIGPKHDAYSTEYRCPDKSFQFNLYYSGYEAGVPFFICNFCQTEADKRKHVVA